MLYPDSYIHPWLVVFLFFSQGGQWLSWRHAARLGHWDRSVFTRPHGPRGRGALRPVRRATGGQRCLRLHGQSVGPRDGDLPPHTAGPHQQSVLITGERLHTHSVVCALFFAFVQQPSYSIHFSDQHQRAPIPCSKIKVKAGPVHSALKKTAGLGCTSYSLFPRLDSKSFRSS